jgi:cytochrome P450
MTVAPFLDVKAADFSIRSAPVLAAREQHWYATTPYGIAILRYEDTNALQNDKRLHQGTRRWPEHNEIQSELLVPWWNEMMLSLEGQDHIRIRKLANPAFSPKIIEALKPEFTKLANDLIDGFCEKGSAEFMSEFAEPYSAKVITLLLGLPPELWREIADLATKLGYVFSVTIKQDLPEIEAGLRGILAITQNLIDTHTELDPDSFISTMVQATVDGQKITERELLVMLSFIVFAGFDTTRNQLGLAMQVFMQNPKQWDLLSKDPDLARNAVEEAMRLNPTITWFTREAIEDFEYKDLQIKKGTTLQFFNVPVGSDPAKYESIAMDITKSRAPHFGFGGGMHHCLGHYVARIDMQEALKALAKRLPDFKIENGAKYLPDSGNTGPIRMPITFTPSARI